ncbi:MAG: hypothetical protein R2729_32840 [Bryobacteraceae bacterium]
MGLLEPPPRLTPISVRQVLRSCTEALARTEGCRGVEVNVPEGPLPIVAGMESLLPKALNAVLVCAARLVSGVGFVEVNCREERSETYLTVTSQGRSIPAQTLPNFFDLLAFSEDAVGCHLGLGPALAARILPLMGGSITARNVGASAAEFVVRMRSARLQ